VRLVPGDLLAGARAISTVGDGIAALQRYGLERLKADGIWGRALELLRIASSDPTPENVASAREGLVAVARAAGVLIE
jgi:hypothetical protein